MRVKTSLDASPNGAWDVFAITDGRIVTGANPAGARVMAKTSVKVFQQL